ncbi:hypothetical protein HDU98_004257 [Podochytrium sp. JEL0797]|nr:hypothetical protein HDU98_004257 [Podochytrium sp. JEL0797]
MSETQPLLAHQHTASNSDEDSYGSYVLRSFGLHKATRTLKVGVALGGFGLLMLGVWAVVEFGGPHPPNVIMLVSDGFGPASMTMARNYNAFVNDLGPEAILPLDSILVGSSRTRSSSSFVTDSAAGATAFSCALKTYNGAIAVDPDTVPCGTILEAAKLRGYMTGLVVTSSITDATPASFSSHVLNRWMQDQIAIQQIGNYSLGRMVDLAFGGGSCFFKPQTGNNPESCRFDDLDVFGWAKEKLGWSVLETVDEFRALDSENIKLPLMGLFARDSLSFELDRDHSKQPSLKEMAMKALDILSYSGKKSRKGFFIMIEGSRIDIAGHNNDPAAQVHEVLAYNEMIASVIEWVDKHPNTIMISTSDHETGGLSVAHQMGTGYPDYAWYPSALVPVQNSTEVLGPFLSNFPNTAAFPAFVSETVVPKWLGISDASSTEMEFLTVPNRTSKEYADFIAHMVSDRAGLGWATHGHSAVDVNLYAHGHMAEALRGNHENTDIGKFMVALMKVDLAKVTTKLMRSAGWWDRVVEGYSKWTIDGALKDGYHDFI